MARGIIAFSHGIPKTIRPNIIVAENAQRFAEEWNTPIFTQEDVNIRFGDVSLIRNKNGKAPSTIQICDAAVNWALDRGIDEVFVVCAAPHWWRALRDLNWAIERAGANITIGLCPQPQRYPTEDWYCGTQWYTKSRERYSIMNAIFWYMPMWLYVLITKNVR